MKVKAKAKIFKEFGETYTGVSFYYGRKKIGKEIGRNKTPEEIAEVWTRVQGFSGYEIVSSTTVDEKRKI